MTDNLEELERLLAKATPGEWIADRHEIRIADGPARWGKPGGRQERANAALIVALKNAAPSLIATAREVEGLRAALSDAIALIGHRMPMTETALVAGEKLVAGAVWKAGVVALEGKGG